MGITLARSKGWRRAGVQFALAPVVMLVAGLALPASGRADGGAPAPSDPPSYRAGVEAIRAGDFPKAIALLKEHVADKPGDANGWNWLGYASRKTGDLDAAFSHYRKALTIDPKHRGAHEYIGEAYLMAKDPAKAEEHLKILDRLCFLPCEEFSDLKKAIAAYRKSAH
jgi:cytochrome c-type biogenesis protein CcmH/NrfG